MKINNIYDLAIIGGGPAGYSAALEAAQQGLEIVLFEYREIGGTCLNRGCVPTKYMAHIAEEYAEYSSIQFDSTPIRDYFFSKEVFFDKRNAIVDQLRGNLLDSFRQGRIDVIYDKAFISSNKEIIAGDNSYKAHNILIATGSYPVEPLVKNAITSDELLNTISIPKRIKIIGGGVSAVEFASIFNMLGTKVTMCLRGNRLLRKFDKDISRGLLQNFKKSGIDVLFNCGSSEIDSIESDITVSLIGRFTKIDDLVAPELHLNFDKGIIVDENGKTNVDNIFAAGDVIEGSVQLAHVAMEQGKRVVNYILGKKLTNSKSVVHCIYVKPEIAAVGITEDEAKGYGLDYITVRQPMQSNARTLIENSQRGFVKLIVDKESRLLLGAHLMCERATDIIAELAVAIDNKITVDALAETMRPHPSFCEEITQALDKIKGKLS